MKMSKILGGLAVFLAATVWTPSEASADMTREQCVQYFNLHRTAEVVPSEAICQNTSRLRMMDQPNFDRCISYFSTHRLTEKHSPSVVCNQNDLLLAMNHRNFARCTEIFSAARTSIKAAVSNICSSTGTLESVTHPHYIECVEAFLASGSTVERSDPASSCAGIRYGDFWRERVRQDMPSDRRHKSGQQSGIEQRSRSDRRNSGHSDTVEESTKKPEAGTQAGAAQD